MGLELVDVTFTGNGQKNLESLIALQSLLQNPRLLNLTIPVLSANICVNSTVGFPDNYLLLLLLISSGGRRLQRNRRFQNS